MNSFATVMVILATIFVMYEMIRMLIHDFHFEDACNFRQHDFHTEPFYSSGMLSISMLNQRLKDYIPKDCSENGLIPVQNYTKICSRCGERLPSITTYGPEESRTIEEHLRYSFNGSE